MSFEEIVDNTWWTPDTWHTPIRSRPVQRAVVEVSHLDMNGLIVYNPYKARLICLLTELLDTAEQTDLHTATDNTIFILFCFFLCVCVYFFQQIIMKTYLFKYNENFTTKNWKFSDKKNSVFHISAQNTDCG